MLAGVGKPYRSSKDRRGAGLGLFLAVNVMRKLGGRVVYRIDDLQAWVNRGSKASTTDETGQSVSPAKPHAAPLARYAGQPHR